MTLRNVYGVLAVLSALGSMAAGFGGGVNMGDAAVCVALGVLSAGFLIGAAILAAKGP